MTATAAREVLKSEGRAQAYPVMTLTTIYKGTMVSLNATGYAVSATDAATDIGFVGIARETIDNSAGASGAKYVTVETKGVYQLNCYNGIGIQANVGTLVCVYQNDTVAVAGSTTYARLVGRIVEVISTAIVRVAIDEVAMGALVLGSNTVAAASIASSAVTTAKIADANVTAAKLAVNSEVILTKRQRVTVSAINAATATGVEILAAVAAVGYRVVGVRMIAYGGALAATSAATGVKLVGTQSAGAVALYTVLLAAGTRSAVCEPGVANTSVLADGASFMVCDDNTNLALIGVTAGAYDLITATGIDIEVRYVLET